MNSYPRLFCWIQMLMWSYCELIDPRMQCNRLYLRLLKCAHTNLFPSWTNKWTFISTVSFTVPMYRILMQNFLSCLSIIMGTGHSPSILVVFTEWYFLLRSFKYYCLLRISRQLPTMMDHVNLEYKVNRICFVWKKNCMRPHFIKWTFNLKK